MRTIRRISAAFRLLDSYSKGPVLGAAILVDGRRMPYVAKGDGTYVFSDLPPMPHAYEISAPGYRTVRRSLPAVPPYFPEVVLMPYAPGTPALERISCFRLRFLRGERPLAEKKIRATLMTAVGALRLVEPGEKGGRALALAGGYAQGLLYQHYCARERPASDLFITDYDQGTGQFLLQSPLETPLKKGGLLRPVWELETDWDGAAVLPAIGLFLQREEVELSFTLEGQEQRLLTAPPSPSLRAVVEFEP